MSEAVIISFYASRNLGDVGLSAAIDRLIEARGLDLVRHDFCSAERIARGQSLSRIRAGQEETPIQPRWYSLRGILGRGLMIPALGQIRTARVRLWYLRKRHAGRWAELSEAVQRSSMLVLGGGNMIMDLDPMWPALFLEYCRLAEWAHKPCHVLLVGAGPIHHAAARKLFRRAMSRVASISVRDHPSRQTCLQLAGPRQVLESVDPVFSLPLNKLGQRLARLSRPSEQTAQLRVGICGLGPVCFESEQKHGSYCENLLRVAERLITNRRRRVQLTLFSSAAADYATVRNLSSRLERRWPGQVTISWPESVDELLNLYEGLDVLLGGRMHSLVFAHKCLLPHVGIIWQDKVLGYARCTGQPGNVVSLETMADAPERVAQLLLERADDRERVERMHMMNGKLKQRVEDIMQVLEYAGSAQK